MAPALDPDRLGDHLDRLYRAAWALSGSREDAEDLVQETYARVLARPRFLRHEDDLGYLLRVLRNTFLNARRTRARRPQTDPLPEGAEFVEVRDMDTMNQITANMLFIKNSIFFDNMGADGNWPAAMATGDIDEKAIFTNAAWMNREVDPMLGDASNLTAPNFKPAAGSPALTGGAMPPSGDAFFEQVSFVGAVGTDDWTTGWTAYPQN